MIDLTGSSDDEFQSPSWDARSAKPSLSNRTVRKGDPANTHIVDLTGDEPEKPKSPPPRSVPNATQSADRSLQKPIPSMPTFPVPKETPSPDSPTVIKTERPTTSSVPLPTKTTGILTEPLSNPKFRDKSVPGEKDTSPHKHFKYDGNRMQESIQRSSSLVIAGSSMSTDASELRVPVRPKKRALSPDDLEKPLQKCLRDRRDDHQYYVKVGLFVHLKYGIAEMPVVALGSCPAPPWLSE